MSSCAICRAPLRDAVPVASHARFGLDCRRVACGACGLVQQDPQPLAAELNEYYRSHEYRRDHGKVCIDWGPHGTIAPTDPRWPQAFAAMGYARRTHAINLSGKTEGAVLDVGCGPGHVLDGFTELGWETYGLEPDTEEAAKAMAKGTHRIQACTLERYEPPRDFDLIVSHHVLEHLPDPIGALKRMRSMLAEGGRLVIEVPNILNPHGPLTQNHFQWVHLYDFSRWTLGDAFRRAGLTYVYDDEASALWAVGEKADEGRGEPGPPGMYVAGYLDGYRVFGGGD